MKYFVLAFLLPLLSCNGTSNNSSPKITQGDIAGSQASKAFVQNAKTEIPISLQLNSSDLDSLSQDGLLTAEESLQISENL